MYLPFSSEMLQSFSLMVSWKESDKYEDIIDSMINERLTESEPNEYSIRDWEYKIYNYQQSFITK